MEVNSIKQFLRPHLASESQLKKNSYYSVRETDLLEIAFKKKNSLMETMIACLEKNIWPECFRCNRGIFSHTDQIKLLNNSVAIIGLGGLGGTAALTLARLGLGKLILVDGDIFEESNLNRQIIANHETLGQAKTKATTQSIIAINPVIKIQAYTEWACENNLDRLLKNSMIALDCLDNLYGRYILQEATSQANIPLIHGSVAGLEGILMIIQPGEPGLKALYGPKPIIRPKSDENILGIPAIAPAVLANLQVAEAIKLILGRPSLPSGIALHLDLETLTLNRLELSQYKN